MFVTASIQIWIDALYRDCRANLQLTNLQNYFSNGILKKVQNKYNIFYINIYYNIY